MSYVLGLDVGTGGARAIIVDEAGTVVAEATSEYPLYTPRPLWAEQDPAEWWQATQAAIGEAIHRAAIRPDQLRAAGLTGQMHGAVFLDADDEVLRPAMLWCDQRTQAECDWITEQVGLTRLMQIACNPALPGFQAPKIIWVRDHSPEVYERIRCVLLPKDYVRFLLTGEKATEVSDASGTLLLDVPQREWSAELLATLGIDREWLPTVHEAPVVSGHVTAEAAELTGLPAGLPVVGGAGDQAAAGVGNGIVGPGPVSATVGSSGVVFAYQDKPEYDEAGRVHTFCHAVPGAWHVMGVTQGAGLSLRWCRDELGDQERAVAAHTGHDPYDLLIAEASRAPAGSEGLIYLPYLMGERTPHLDATARAVWFGLTGRHTRSHLLRAVLEGVTYSLRDCLQLLVGMGVRPSTVRASGGGARSTFWRQLQADIYGLPVETLAVSEGTSYGAALLAGVGAAWWSSVPEACQATIKPVATHEPDSDNHAIYDRFHTVYQDLYPALQGQFARVTQLADEDVG
ncbi:MAG: xylulokinase [Dehalococcoidia bacterium]|nr:xylulokinase [Dehalococcoidia bacterium]